MIGWRPSGKSSISNATRNIVRYAVPFISSQYVTGDFVDDDWDDEDDHNDLLFPFIMEVEQGPITRIRLYQICINGHWGSVEY